METVEHRIRGSFPGRIGGLDSRGDIRLAIRRDAPATDLPRERPVVRLREIVVTVPPEEVKSGQVKLRALVDASNGAGPLRRQSSGTLHLELR